MVSNDSFGMVKF